MNIYSLRSKTLKFYNVPFYEADDISVFNLLRNVVYKGQDTGLISNLDDLELVCLGQFDTSEGIVKAKNRHVIDLIDIPDILKMRSEVLDHVQNPS